MPKFQWNRNIQPIHKENKNDLMDKSILNTLSQYLSNILESLFEWKCELEVWSETYSQINSRTSPPPVPKEEGSENPEMEYFNRLIQHKEYYMKHCELYSLLRDIFLNGNEEKVEIRLVQIQAHETVEGAERRIGEKLLKWDGRYVHTSYRP